MSTIEQQAVGTDHDVAQDMSAAVEAQMGKIVTELGAALGVWLTSLGTRSGLWAALAGAGPLTTEEVAAKVLVDPALVREWLRAQAAAGYLDYEPVGGTFRLPDAVAAAGPATSSSVTAADAQFRLFESVSQSLRSLADRRPLLVVLDDLQWSDETSLRLLGFLAQTLATSRVLLLGASWRGHGHDWHGLRFHDGCMSDARLGAGDCERIRPAGLAQPVNAVTSVAYCGAGWVVTARCWGRVADRRPEVVAYAKLLGLVGVGSLAYHGPQVPGSKALHDWPIAALLAVVAVTPVVRRRRGRSAFPGWTRARGARLAATGTLAGAAYATGRSTSPACHPDSRVQMHGVWHLLSAAAFVEVADILYRGAPPDEVRTRSLRTLSPG